MPETGDTPRRPPLTLRPPRSEDGAAIWNLVRACKPLDENSLYCNLVQADHFRDTCVLAEREGAVLGWISGHMIPGAQALFVWQVAVSPAARGLGLGRQMLHHLIARPACTGARALRTTITAENAASRALFRSFARSIGGQLHEAPHYLRDRHLAGRHATEHLVTIALPATLRLPRAA